MKSIIRNLSSAQLLRLGLLGLVALAVTACSSAGVPPHLRPLSKDAMHLLGKKGMSAQNPVFIRIFKEESELEVWKARDDGRFYHFKTYPICNWSGKLGPKLKQGDKQAPEGFYAVRRGQLNPNSDYHLSFNIGYPNQFDRAHGRTGNFLMVHGDCRSAGCYAMTDALVEEIYALVREAFSGGQEVFHLHAYPFRMTAENLERHRRSQYYSFWLQMKEGYDYFELTRQPPRVNVCGKRYLVNARFVNGEGNVSASAPCPPYEKLLASGWTRDSVDNPAILQRVVVPGRKTRNLAAERRRKLAETPRYGLTSTKPGTSNISLSATASDRSSAGGFSLFNWFRRQ